VICPLCGVRKARRGCPALNQQICAVCCGTKRIVEIPCPTDCTWLASAREHPPAIAVRQQRQDLGLLVGFMRDFNRRQSQLFFLVNTFINEYRPSELQTVVDEDVADAVDALASTYETASRGVIYEHRPASLPAERLLTALKPVVAEAGQGLGSSFDRDASVVLRRVRDAVRDARAANANNPRAFLELLRRVLRPVEQQGEKTADSAAPGPARSSLILPP
jgi:hypothetical protein